MVPIKHALDRLKTRQGQGGKEEERPPLSKFVRRRRTTQHSLLACPRLTYPPHRDVHDDNDDVNNTGS